MNDTHVSVQQASKAFKEVCALRCVDASFERGKIHGIIGRNGSGKTVLIKCICGFMRLSAGRILIDGQPVKPAAPQNIGVIIETPGFIGSLSGYQNLSYLASLKGVIGKEDIERVLQCVGLDPAMKKAVRKYSLGMRQRLGIAQAIMERPPLLVFDEPMNGLDNRGVEDMRALFRSLREEGKTILLASHNPLDIDGRCDTVCEMDAGVLRRVR